ncbi:Protein hedgehog [Gracilariopsis chorda]|uniref:Protein hedgehog n=1 Tax=Gracilariopsis chorda TaxID=448386 RepID=A0A2V3IE59_9FLOR|nr:Protein hedgehog [Gracilariopsis chorda]|eukprot:PXF40379.1 Protein hedgehog [Gracilariopsis chorda]
MAVRTAAATYSPVHLFSHKDADVVTEFVKITVRGGELRVSPKHYVYKGDGIAVTADSIRVGDIMIRNGENAVVEKVEAIVDTGLFNPHTLDSSIVVDGFSASCYTAAMEAKTAHSLLAPLRMLFRISYKPLFALEKGSELLAKALPSGKDLML